MNDRNLLHKTVLKISILSFLFLFLFSNTVLSQSQFLVNKNWQILNGNPASGIEWAATVVDTSGNIITTGNTVDASFNVNLIVVKQSSTGQLLWEEEFNAGVGSKNFGIALTTDNSGNIYVTGATYNLSNQNHDYLILKYNSSGTLLWSHIENGLDNGEDIPSSIAIDASNNVYVTGGSYSNTNDYDYLTLRLDANGTFNWKERYDYNNLPDAAIAVKADASGNLRISGSSSSSLTTWDYANLRYSAANGSLLSEHRSSNGLETPTDLAMTSNDYMVVTGYGGLQNDCYTLLLDQNFNQLWDASYDGSGLEDRALDVEVDNNDNVYICGYTEKNNGGKDFLLIKYDSNGNELWVKKRSARDRNLSAKALFLEVDHTNNYIIVTGEEEMANGNSVLKTTCYNTDGELIWEDIHDGNPNYPEKATGLIIGDNDVFTVTGVIQNTGNHQEYEMINYEPFLYDTEYDYDSLGFSPTNIDGEIIIRFYPTVVDTAFVDNPDLIYGTVDEIITDNNLISNMDQKFQANGEIRDWTMVKVYPFLSTSERTIVSNYDQIIPLPSVWTTYKLLLEGNISESDAVDSLATLAPTKVLYSTVIPVGQLNASPPNANENKQTESDHTLGLKTTHLVNQFNPLPPPPPNDPHYIYQSALHSTNGFNDVHINIEPAWDQVDGDPSIRVGLVDSGLSFAHPEFGYGGGYGGLGGSIVQAGFHMIENTSNPIPFDDNDIENDFGWPHGTRLAGIIGALRNNAEGISGVAGGNINGGLIPDLPQGPGVSLFIFEAIDSEDGYLTPLDSGKSILFAGTGGDGSGNMVDVLNNSYGLENDSGASINVDNFLREYMIPTYKSGMVMVASRGNIEGLSTDEIENYPGTFSDRMIINVGASGTDGELKESLANSSGNSTNELLMGMYGKDMDIIAPGTNNLIVTTNSLQVVESNPITCDDPLHPEFSDNSNYNCFNGSSSATAYTTGVAALLMEQSNKHNIRLAQEDVERLLEYGATHIIGTENYDPKNAWGRLNAGASVGLITGTQKVVHFQVFPQMEVICKGCAIEELTYLYESADPSYNGTGIFPAEELYGVNVRKHTYDVNIDFCTEYNGAQVIDPGIAVEKDPAWLLNSRSNLWGKAFQDFPDVAVETNLVPEDNIYWESGPILTGCTLTGTIVGYSYEIINTGGQIIPNNGNPFQMWFSVLVDDINNSFDDIVIPVKENEITTPSQILLFPNPTKDKLTVKMSASTKMVCDQLEVYDISGKKVQSHLRNKIPQKRHHWELDISNLVPGVYIVKVITDIGIFQSRFLKI